MPDQLLARLPLFVLEHNAVFFNVDGYHIIGREAARQNGVRQAIFDFGLNEPPQGSGAKLSIVAMFTQPIPGRIGCRDGQVVVDQSLVHFFENNIHNLANIFFGQLAENDDAVNAVDELGAEFALQLIMSVLRISLCCSCDTTASSRWKAKPRFGPRRIVSAPTLEVIMIMVLRS
jgi:hypothetical protein